MARTRGTRRDYLCSFCGKSQEQVQRLIAGPGGIFICDGCVDLCREILEEEKQSRPVTSESETMPHEYPGSVKAFFAGLPTASDPGESDTLYPTVEVEFIGRSSGSQRVFLLGRDAALGISSNGLVARSLHGEFHICALNGATLVSPQHEQSAGVACSTDDGATWNYYAMPRVAFARGPLEGMSLVSIANDGSLLATVVGTLYHVDVTASSRLQSLGPIPEPGVVYCPTPGDGILWAGPVSGYTGDPQHRIFTARYSQ